LLHSETKLLSMEESQVENWISLVLNSASHHLEVIGMEW
jgi:hypothetical protein